MRAVNVDGTANILNASVENGVKRFIQISSTGVIGSDVLNASQYNENSLCLPKSDYEKSKLEAEKVVLSTRSGATETVILRPTNIFGEGDPNFTLFSLSRAVKRNRFVFVGGRRSLINMVYVKDVANAIQSLVEYPDRIKGKIFHISDTCSIGDFIDCLTDELAVKRINLAFPDFVGGILRSLLKILRKASPQIEDKAVYGRVASLCSQSSFKTDELEKNINFKYKYGWRYGLKTLVAWYHAQGAL